MPSGNTNMTALLEKVKTVIVKIGGTFKASKEEPMAFGIKALMVTLVIDEEKGTDAVETALSALEGVSSVQVASYDRIG